MKLLSINNTKAVAFVDDIDFDRLSKLSWTLGQSSIHRTFRSKDGTTTVPLSNEVMQKYDIMYDHVNRNLFDNRKVNLRESDYSKNNHNKSKIVMKYSARRVSKYKGVSAHKVGWKVRIQCNKKSYFLGLFSDEIDDAKAYDNKAKELYGAHAFLNFKDTDDKL